MKIFDEKTSPGEVIRFLTELAKQGRYVFRGYSKQDELLPNIVREEASYDEKQLLTDLERYGGHYFHANSPVEFMSYAQHFGLPTRLLDFSHNPFIALAFAIYGQKGSNYKNAEDKNYYYIRYADLKDNIAVSIQIP